MLTEEGIRRLAKDSMSSVNEWEHVRVCCTISSLSKWIVNIWDFRLAISIRL